MTATSQRGSRGDTLSLAATDVVIQAVFAFSSVDEVALIDYRPVFGRRFLRRSTIDQQETLRSTQAVMLKYCL